MNERIQNGTELYHHGILGQKWGVRRFQNPDGTRTAAGKKRYSSDYSEEDVRAAKAYLSTRKDISPEDHYYSLEAGYTNDRHDLIAMMMKKTDPREEWTKEDEELTKLVVDDLRRTKRVHSAMGDLISDNGVVMPDKNTKRQNWFKQENDYYNEKVKQFKKSNVKLDFDLDEFSTVTSKIKHSDTYSDELYHHGILGQKWGVRRFQNKDGSVTSAGAKRYYEGDGEISGPKKPGAVKRFITNRRKKKEAVRLAEEKVRKEAEDKAKKQAEQERIHGKDWAIKSGNAEQVRKYRDQMTNDELQRAINRVNMYKQLDSVDKHDSNFDKAMKIVDTGLRIGRKVAEVKETADRVQKLFNPEDEGSKLSKKIDDAYSKGLIARATAAANEAAKNTSGSSSDKEAAARKAIDEYIRAGSKKKDE